MRALPIARLPIVTKRRVLRPSSVQDASRAVEIRSDWEVSRMLRMAAFPPDATVISPWFADHEREWTAGEAYRFAIVLDETMIGLVDIDIAGETEGVLGYWLDHAAWGQGYASEAAGAAVRFAFETAGLSKLKAGHALDNEASGRVLRKLGFREIDAVQRFSHSRCEDVVQRRYLLTSYPRWHHPLPDPFVGG